MTDRIIVVCYNCMIVWDMDMWPDCGCDPDFGGLANEHLAQVLGDRHIADITLNDIEHDDRQLRLFG
jgi:hypothetical protein